MVLNMPEKDEISPSLRHIICQFSGEMPVSAETDFAGQISPEQTFELFGLDVMMMHLKIVEPGDGS
ncbi:hypothetical protein RND71_002495 [Anisodus tanguticus]|uniref:Uncharacterized protein n=1 Tax=Anisodus tanguticus TaxID=243964 RepID=A0AAE1VS04_9SOLA|nr:hypothetical protein RND71_002495 [Anisodus tanguticus]